MPPGQVEKAASSDPPAWWPNPTAPCTQIANPRTPKTKPKYTYLPLPQPNSIRLLLLLPGSGKSPIHCHVAIFSLNEALSFEALSYAWGDINESSTIYCNGSSLTVPRNLQEFLWGIRSPTKRRWLWVDSVCINQEDVKERGHQVKQMAKTYSLAKRVLVWLGPKNYFEYFGGPEEIDLPALADRFLGSFEDHGGDGLPRDYPEIVPAFEDLDKDTHQFWTSLAFLFDHPWWDRLWVVQEAGLGQSVVALFGGLEIDFDLLLGCNYRAYLYSHGILLTEFGIRYNVGVFRLFPNRRCYQSIFYRTWIDDTSEDFLEVLYTVENQLASDPRDHFYALLGHPSAVYQGRSIVTPDYTLSPSRLRHEVATKLLSQTRSLKILSAVRYNGELEFEEASPSWVPSWNARDEYGLGIVQRHYDNHDAAAGSLVSLSLIESDAILRVKGFVFDTVKDLTSVLGRDYFIPITEAIGFQTGNQAELPNRLLELAFILTLDRFYPDRDIMLADFAAIRLKFWEEKQVSFPETSRIVLPEGKEWAELTASRGNAVRFKDRLEYSRNKRMFSTADGMLGIGSRVLKKGDLCCIFFGHNLPIALRPYGSKFKLVGEAYISGVDHGEAMEGFRNGKFKEQIFDIV
ncbi:heterokaryon incompatibility protein-domain-containing protein [Clohesyomyces aquaticus]|uniref:Heterokaryon incompatibility protein-domain-containing protein n=1 Tax=Clohesyomyces aquaticus TaxID=1231657 RepID=A0A1Y1YT84_9PLEO|nr:heterokaryon incompatibility protein-domain-containing protein [Clohesyomyces aquaticus]